ncbi:hypothetical protein ABK040_002678 [Willaertia magna]
MLPYNNNNNNNGSTTSLIQQFLPKTNDFTPIPRLSNLLREKIIGSPSLQLFDTTKSYYQLFPIIENKRKEQEEKHVSSHSLTFENFIKPKIQITRQNFPFKKNVPFDRHLEEQNGKNLVEHFIESIETQLQLDKLSLPIEKAKLSPIIAKQLYIAKRKYKTLNWKHVLKDLQHLGIGLPKGNQPTLSEKNFEKVFEMLDKLLVWVDRFAREGLIKEEEQRYEKLKFVLGCGKLKKNWLLSESAEEGDGIEDEGIEFGSERDENYANHLYHSFQPLRIFSKEQLEKVFDKTMNGTGTDGTNKQDGNVFLNAVTEEEGEEEISGFNMEWLQEECSKVCDTPGIENVVMEILQKEKLSDIEIQSSLFDVLGENAFELMSVILEHKSELLKDLYKNQVGNLLEDAHSHARIHTQQQKDALKKLRKENRKHGKNKKYVNSAEIREMEEQRRIYEAIKSGAGNAIKEGEGQSRFVVLGRDVLPEEKLNEVDKDSQERVIKGDCYIEHVFPAPKKREDNQPRVPISVFEDWAQLAFKGVTHLNRVQSDVFYSAYKSNENLLICAPTGCGKTNVAMMTILREIGQHFKGGKIRREEFKIIYIAPMKALASEMVSNFSKRLAPLGINVKEMTGDMQLSKKEVQQTQMIVTTPEKWDVTTRKATDASLLQLTKLIIIDEIHLLNEDRGPVIESIVARTLRQVESSQSLIRIVGLSATLPNYKDVASFLRVNPYSGLFYFDGSYRPVPLEQSFIGVTTKNPLARAKEYNQITYNKVLKNLKNNKQVMVFVHSRRETVQTARALQNLATEDGTLDLFSGGDKPLEFWAKKALEKCHNRELKELVPLGFAVHNAGLVRADRNLVEKLFAEGVVKVLCCTSTLAWGVNLPAYCTVIKGTEIYNAEKSQVVDLGMLDVNQIFGRAGRPQFDDSGEGVIITSYDSLPKYLNLMKHNLPIESTMTQDLANHLCAEIVLGTVANIKEGIQWLSYTYLYLRMKQNPMNYGLTHEEVYLDPTLLGTRKRLIESACKVLHETKMIVFDEKSGVVSATDLGRIASHYYIHHETIKLYNEKLTPHISEPEVLQIVASAREFKNIKVRDDEISELSVLMEEAPVQPIKGGIQTYEGKVNVLIQAYISRVKLKSSSLISDCAFITQSVERIMRALFEISMKEKWSSLVDKLLTLAKCMDRRQWVFEHPLRQMPKVPLYIIHKLEDKDLTLARLVDYDEGEVDQIMGARGMGKIVFDNLDKFPHLELEATVQPITRNVLRFQVKVRPDFIWDRKIHGETDAWWVWVEDEQSLFIYHSEYLLLKEKEVEKMKKESKSTGEDPYYTLNFVVPFREDPKPLYFIIRAVNDRWLSAEAEITVDIKDIILPEGFSPSTSLLPLEPLPISALHNPDYERLFTDKGIQYFNPVQTQIFHATYHTDENIIVGAPTGSGKTIAAELCMLRLFTLRPKAKVIYIAPLKALVRERLEEWELKFVKKLGKKLVELSGDYTPDIKALKQADIVITTPEKWDGISRNWQQREYVRDVGLMIMDEIHLLGSDRGAILEVITSRMRYIAWNTGAPIRMLGLSTNMANATDLADWLGVGATGLFNFKASVRPIPLQVSISGFSGKHYCPRMNSMNKPAYQAILRYSNGRPTLIFVSSRRQTRLTAMDIISFCNTDDNPQRFINMTDIELLEAVDLAKDQHLKHCLSYGVAIHHAGLTPSDKKLVEELFRQGKILVLVATSTLAWGVNLPASLVIIKGTEYFDPKTKRYEDYPLVDVLQMAGRAGRPNIGDVFGRVFIMVQDVKKNFYKRFLYEPFPIESGLHTRLHDHINAEIVSGTIKTKQDCIDYLTWTFMFRRLLQNPYYYGIEDLSYEGLNKWLSQLITSILDDLEFAGLVKITSLASDKTLRWKLLTQQQATYGSINQLQQQEGKSQQSTKELKETILEPTPIAIIASYYYLSYRTASHFNRLVNAKSSVNYLLELLCEAYEFEEIPVRHNEDKLNQELSQAVPLGVYLHDFESPHIKTYLLLQAHIERVKLPIVDYITDTRTILDSVIRIAQAYIDICAEKGFLSSCMNVMKLLQMTMQARWDTNSSLLQLFSNLPAPKEDETDLTPTQENCYSFIKSLETKENITNLRQLLEIRYKSEDGKQKVNELISKYVKSKSLVTNIVKVLDEFPYINVKVDKVVHDEKEHQIEVVFTAQRLSKLKEEAYTPMYSKQKDEGFWAVIGNDATNELLALRRVRLQRKEIQAELFLPITENDKNLTLYLIPDCYLGLDCSSEFLCKI